ncbi:recombinase family protein [Verrucomicrobium sp. BvORR106]|uniref:recombinase family protein n=1 Tax=Verrucomicrobium sp. BvORR106 TaxID=1403819 RepID=UPI00069096A9|nr:recombinase family protein [Verrucomicrobium sp. BvORR106]
MQAYSYIRFSSGGQAKGDSLRRQVALTRQWCESRGVALVEDYRDLGVSAFRGKNATQGALFAFLTKVEDGSIPRGSTLVVESLDRITRADLSEAVALFLRLINGGITVVTLADGREYDKARVNDNMGELMLSLVVLARANDESRTKSRRIGAAWEQRRLRALAGKDEPSKRCPMWLRVKGGAYEPIPDKVKAVRLMFDMMASGSTLRDVALELQARKVKPARAETKWSTRAVMLIIRSRAVLGERVMYATDISRRVVMPTHYPAIIPPEVFIEANRLLSSRVQKSGRFTNANPFRGLLYDEAGNSCHLVQQHKDNGRVYGYLVSYDNTTLRCKSVGWKISDLLSFTLSLVDRVTLARKGGASASGGKTRDILRQELLGINERIDTLVQVISRGYSSALERGLRDLEAQKEGLEMALRKEELEGGPDLPTLVRMDWQDPVKLGANFRAVLSSIELAPGRFKLHFREGGTIRAMLTPEGLHADIDEELVPPSSHLGRTNGHSFSLPPPDKGAIIEAA